MCQIGVFRKFFFSSDVSYDIELLYLNHEDSVRLIKSADLLVNFFFIGAEKETISGKIMEYLAHWLHNEIC